MKKIAIVIAVILLIAVVALFAQGQNTKTAPADSQTNIPAKTNQDAPTTTITATDLDVPWALAFLPDGSMLATERTGNLVRLENGEKKVIAKLPVKIIGEGGLLGLALDPNFEKNNYIYLYYTFSSDGNNTLNRVVRFKLSNDKLTDEKVLIGKIPGATFHNGGRIKFGPDGFLYITTGDAQEPSRAQDKNSLAGKILRVTKDGTAAPGNPFKNRVYSYGHRNPQGITWSDDGKLWATEHGPSGLDELNKIESGKNYGWPTIQGNETRPGMIPPTIQSQGQTWAPAGMIFLNGSTPIQSGSIFFGGLKGETLYEYKIAERTIIEHLKGEFGRIRDVVLGPDGQVYITTSNTDGRGDPKPEDDKIIKINPDKLTEL